MTFSGMRALVVEDEGSVALLLEDMLVTLGCEIAASVARLAQACTLAQTGTFDFAILDVNLAGELGFPVAHILRERGIPFLFSTGYGESAVPPEFGNYPVLGKPFSMKQLRETISAALSGGGDLWS
jgi:DNA-binding response OmpR family regulator